MHGRRGRCPQGGAVQNHLRETSQGTGTSRGTQLAKKSLLLWGCAAASLALSVQAFAQSPTLPQVTVEGKSTKAAKKGTAKGAPKAAPAEPVQQVETTEAREKAKKEAVYQTPAAVSTATKSDLETFGQLDTGDVLRSMPGTSTRESFQNPGLAVNIRGLEGSGRVNMMVDGVRQNFRFTTHEAQGFVYVDQALLAGVDISRGAVSTAGGAGALVGTANMRTLGVDDIIKPGQKTGVLSVVTYGTNHVGWKEMIAAGATNGTVGIAGAFSHSEPNDYKNGNGTIVPFTRQDLNSGLFKMDFALSSDQTLKLGAVFYENDFFANSYLQNVTSETSTLKYAYRPRNNPLMDLALNAHANQVHMVYIQDATPLTGVPPKGTAAGRNIKDNGTGFDVSNTSRFGFGGLRVAATYGYEYFVDEVDAFNTEAANVQRAGGVNPAGKSSIGGAFSQTQFSYNIFDFIVGLRYDTFSIQGSYDTDPLDPLNPLSSLDRSDGRFNPKVTLAAQMLPWLQPYVTYAETFRAPTINETMIGGSHPGGSFGFEANPLLEPEIQRGWEFGANIRQNRIITPGDAFRLKAAYFLMNVDNYITGCDGPGGNTTFCNTQGKSQVDGVEVEGSYDAGVAFAGLSYTYVHSKLPEQLDGLGGHSFLPEHTLVATGGMRFLDQKLTVGARASYFSESYVGNLNVGAPGFASYGSPFMPGYALVDLFSSYKFDSGFELGATITNLLNVDYTPALATPITPFAPPVTATNCFGSNLSPNCTGTGRGRTFLFTMKSHF